MKDKIILKLLAIIDLRRNLYDTKKYTLTLYCSSNLMFYSMSSLRYIFIIKNYKQTEWKLKNLLDKNALREIFFDHHTTLVFFILT